MREFDEYNRSDNFSVEGRQALFDYLENLEDDTGEKIELDIISLCCDYTEYKNLKELQENYNNIVVNQELQIKDWKFQYNALQLKNHKLKIRAQIGKIGAGLVIAGLTFLLVK